MKVLFLMLAFPDLNKSSNLYTDLVEEFRLHQHDIYAVAPLQPKDGKTKIYQERGINILRVKTFNLFSKSLIVKGIANIFLSYQYKTAINKHFKNVCFDLIIMPTPPITLVDVAIYFKKKYASKFYLILRDIFPQNAVDLGMIKKESFIYTYFRKQEKLLYQKADFIGCMSEGNIRYILEQNKDIHPTKLHVLMNFQRIQPVSDFQIDMKKRYGLENKFIVMFGGNMGIPQKLENILALAEACQYDYEDVIFLLVGKGTQRKAIEEMAKQANIRNVVFMDLIPRDDYRTLVSQCDIGLISLNEKFSIPNIPSKTMDYFNASIPILASIDTVTDYGKMLEESNSGLYSIAGDLKGFKENFDKLYNDLALRQTLGKNGRIYLEKCMSVETAYQTILGYV